MEPIRTLTEMMTSKNTHRICLVCKVLTRSKDSRILANENHLLLRMVLMMFLSFLSVFHATYFDSSLNRSTPTANTKKEQSKLLLPIALISHTLATKIII